MKILFLSRWYPYPPDNGSKIRVSTLLRGLCEMHEVTLISFFGPDDSVSESNFPSPSPKEIYVCPYRDFNSRSCRAILGFLSATPRYLIDTHHPEMEALIRRMVQARHYDLVIASQLSMAAYASCFRGIPAIFEEAELGIYFSGNNLWRRLRNRLTWEKHRRFMGTLLNDFRLCTVASKDECQLLTSAAPAYRSVYVIPNSIDLEQYRQVSRTRVPHSLVFAGSLRYAPNRDAMTWFLSEIFPAIRKEIPEVKLTITGDPGPQPLISALNVTVTGKIRDVHSVVAGSSVSLAPIRIGGGTRLKILESIALGTPVVATRKAVEGLEARDNEHLLIADAPQNFAQAVLRLLRDPSLSRRIAENAFDLFQRRYDSRVILPLFMHLVRHAATV